jgi:DNA-binding XRE family transcriptional regulator
MDPITFKHFISEDFADDFRRKLQMAQKDIADDVDVRRYRISVTNGKIMPNSDVNVSIAVPVPDDYMDGRAFFDRIATLSVEKALKKYFGDFNVIHTDDISWGDGQAVLVAATVQLPD